MECQGNKFCEREGIECEYCHGFFCIEKHFNNHACTTGERHAQVNITHPLQEEQGEELEKTPVKRKKSFDDDIGNGVNNHNKVGLEDGSSSCEKQQKKEYAD